MRQQFAGSFRSNIINPANDFAEGPDNIGTVQINQSQWTAGVTQIDEVLLGGPAQNQHWTLLSASIQAYLGLLINFGGGLGALPFFGKLGRIVGALITDEQTQVTKGPNNISWVSPMLPLPQDSTQSGDLWNPEVNPLPPLINYSQINPAPATLPPMLLPIELTIQPINPVELVPGLSPRLGFWIFPSLIGFSARAPAGDLGEEGMSVAVIAPSFTINYDDGL